MIPQADIIAWSANAPWPTVENVEQDLILSRLMVEIAQHPLLGNELVMRGGTCFHKLWLPTPLRYSEDLDYVRRSDGPVGPILTALREIGEHIGFERTTTEIGRHPKARFRTTANSGRPLNVKVELDTFERSPARPTTVRALRVESAWFNGAADVATFAIEELVATKIRALFQRTKGRDLFDLWLAVTSVGVKPSDIAECFEPYRPAGWSTNLARMNLEAKLRDERFVDDVRGLVQDWPDDYELRAGAAVFGAIIGTLDST